MPMCSAWGGGVFPRRVSPFRHPRIHGYVPLPAAFRSLSRLSSAPGAKASALCPSLLNRLLPAPRLAWRFLGSSRALARLLRIPVPCAAPMGALPPASRRHFFARCPMGSPPSFGSLRQYSVFKVQLAAPAADGLGWARTTPPPAGPCLRSGTPPPGLLSPVSLLVPVLFWKVLRRPPALPRPMA